MNAQARGGKAKVANVARARRLADERDVTPRETSCVRAATARDLDRAALLLDELDRHHARLRPEFFRGASGTARARLGEALGQPDQVLLVAEDPRAAGGGGHGPGLGLAGLLHARLYDTPDDPLLVKRRRGYVELVVVSRACRRQGLGRALMERAASWCRGHGASQLLLTLWQGNDEALAFYRSLGYEPVSQVLGCAL